ncbi:Post-GPI attachment to proteins factor 6 [Nymphon striatum]|nr:Post-GPI attachment to proteins factor 6 [Nymphon striatum]
MTYIFGSITDTLNSINCLLFLCCNSALSDVYQEALLHPYHSYSDVAIFHYYAPSETIRAMWQFAAFSDARSCPSRNVHIFLQHESYPVINPDNSSFPEDMYISQGQVYSLKTKTQYEAKDAVLFSIYNPLPGNWFGIAYIPAWNQEIKQQGVSHKCHYSLDSVASWISYNDVSLLTADVPASVTTSYNHSYFKFYVPENIWSFDIKVFNCTVAKSRNTHTLCIDSFGVSARSLPFPADINKTDHVHSYSYSNRQPQTDVYYYIIIGCNRPQVSYKIVVHMQECVYIWENGQKGNVISDKFKVVPMEVSYSFYHSNGSNIHEDWKKSFNSNVTVTSNFTLVQNASTQQFDETRSNSNPVSCYPVLPLARIKHAQDFLDTFVLQDRNWYSTWLSLTDQYPILTRLQLLPFVDIGGTLQVKLTLDHTLIPVNISSVEVDACIHHASIPKYDESGHVICEPGLEMFMNLEKVVAMKLIPFPHPGLYYISFRPKCYNELNETINCGTDQISLELRIRLQPCIFENQPCGEHGYCVENHRGQFFFSSCKCVGGWKGLGCTDASEAFSKSLLLMETLLITLSNLFFLPAIILAIKRHFYSEALLYTFTMFMSTFYHACDEDVYSYCLMRYKVLQFCDFFSAILSFWVTLVVMADLPKPLQSVAHMAGALGISLGVEYQRTGLWVFVHLFYAQKCVRKMAMKIYRTSRTDGFGFLIIRCHRASNRRTFIKWKYIVKTLIGLTLIGCGLILFTMVETQKNYKYVHSAWHVVVALSIVFLLPKKKTNDDKNSDSLKSSLPSDDSELLDVTNYAVASDLDTLVLHNQS